MNVIINTTILPPLILQVYDSNILSNPCPRLRDGKEDLWRVYSYIKRKLLKPHSLRLRKKQVPQLEQEFLDLYEQVKKKEEEIGREKLNERFFYYITVPNRLHEKIFIRFKYR